MDPWASPWSDEPALPRPQERPDKVEPRTASPPLVFEEPNITSFMDDVDPWGGSSAAAPWQAEAEPSRVAQRISSEPDATWPLQDESTSDFLGNRAERSVVSVEPGHEAPAAPHREDSSSKTPTISSKAQGSAGDSSEALWGAPSTSQWSAQGPGQGRYEADPWQAIAHNGESDREETVGGNISVEARSPNVRLHGDNEGWSEQQSGPSSWSKSRPAEDGPEESVWSAASHHQQGTSLRALPAAQADELKLQARLVAKESLGEIEPNRFYMSNEDDWSSCMSDQTHLGRLHASLSPRPQALFKHDGTLIRDLFNASPVTAGKSREALVLSGPKAAKLVGPSLAVRYKAQALTHDTDSSGQSRRSALDSLAKQSNTETRGWEMNRKGGAAAFAGKLSDWLSSTAASARETPAIVHAEDEGSSDEDGNSRPPNPRSEGPSIPEQDLLGAAEAPAATRSSSVLQKGNKDQLDHLAPLSEAPPTRFGNLWNRWKGPAAKHDHPPEKAVDPPPQFDGLDWLDKMPGHHPEDKNAEVEPAPSNGQSKKQPHQQSKWPKWAQTMQSESPAFDTSSFDLSADSASRLSSDASPPRMNDTRSQSSRSSDPFADFQDLSSTLPLSSSMSAMPTHLIDITKSPHNPPLARGSSISRSSASSGAGLARAASTSSNVSDPGLGRKAFLPPPPSARGLGNSDLFGPSQPESDILGQTLPTYQPLSVPAKQTLPASRKPDNGRNAPPVSASVSQGSKMTNDDLAFFETL